MKILHVGDMHLGSQPPEAETRMLDAIARRAREADLVLLGGDMTNEGHDGEYAALAEFVGRLGDRCLVVRGNHDMGFFMDRARGALPRGGMVQFDARPYPMHLWMANWFEMVPKTYGRFDLPQRVPAPYDRMQQAPVLILYDGVGPYYAVERSGWKFVVLDTCSWLVGERQYTFLRREIASATGPVLIVMHHNILPTGSIYDAAVLWDREPLLDLLRDEPKVQGVVSGHVHYNRVWKVRGKPVITTADRGASRWITLDHDRIADVESLGNHLNPGSGATGACAAAENPARPFLARYEYPVEVIAPDSFTCFKSGLWTNEALGWHAADGPGGLEWRFRNLGATAEYSWFGLNFRSTTPWKVTVARDGNPVLAREGPPGDNIVVSEPIDLAHFETYRVRLEQQPPACGHASPYAVFGAQPVRTFNPYPPTTR